MSLKKKIHNWLIRYELESRSQLCMHLSMRISELLDLDSDDGFEEIQKEFNKAKDALYRARLLLAKEADRVK